MAVCPEAKLVARQGLLNNQFLAFTVPSYFGRDVLEEVMVASFLHYHSDGQVEFCRMKMNIRDLRSALC